MNFSEFEEKGFFKIFEIENKALKNKSQKVEFIYKTIK